MRKILSLLFCFLVSASCLADGVKTICPRVYDQMPAHFTALPYEPSPGSLFSIAIHTTNLGDQISCIYVKDSVATGMIITDWTHNVRATPINWQNSRCPFHDAGPATDPADCPFNVYA